MKKIYNSPSMLCVKLNTVNMMAVSEYSINTSSVTNGSDGDYIGVKGITSKSVWDEEW